MEDQQASNVRYRDEYIRAIRSAATDWRAQQLQKYETWTTETVKHLAFINAAGLAGAFAYSTSSGHDVLPVKLFCVPAIMYFAFGLASAVIDMYANSVGHLRRATELSKRINEWDKLKSPPSTPLDLLSPFRRGKLAFFLAELFGWLSAGGFLLGVIPFIRLGMS